MIVVKGILIILIIVTSDLIGNMKAKTFSKRYFSLKKFKSGLGVFKSKLEFTYEPISEIFEDISKLVYENEENIFQRYVQNNDWNLAVDGEKDFLNDDKEVAKGLGKMLGKLDKSGQLNEINLVDEFLDKQIEQSFEEKQKNEKLYKILGRSAGIAIAIVLI